MMSSQFGTTYIKADQDFRSIVDVDVTMYPAFGNTKKPYSTLRITKEPIVENMPTDFKMDLDIAEYSKKTAMQFGKEIGKSTVKLDANHDTVRYRKSGLCNFITQSMRLAYAKPADVSMVNSGDIRSSREWDSGIITVGNVIEWVPFGNLIMTLHISGKALRALVDAMMQKSCAADGKLIANGEFVHPDGFRYGYERTSEKKGNLVSLEWTNEKTRSGKEMRDDEKFTLNVNSFIYEAYQTLLAGHGVTVVQSATSITVDQAVVNRIEKLKIVSPQLDGRVKLTPRN